MTNRQRVLATFHREEPDRLPFEVGGFNREAHRMFKLRTGSDSPETWFGSTVKCVHCAPSPTTINLGERYLPWHDLPAADYRATHPEIPVPGTWTLLEWGTATVVGSNPAYDHYLAPARMRSARSLDEIEGYPLPDIDADYRNALLPGVIAAAREKDLVAIGGMTCTLFETAWQIRGFDELLCDFLEREELADCLLDRLLAIAVRRACRFVESGVDILFLGDDVGMQDRLMLSPVTWRRYFKPRMAKVIESARAINPAVLFMYHSDGYVEPLIPDLIEIGIQILNPIQPECMDHARLKKMYGAQLAFWGGIGIQRTLVFGTPGDVEEAVKACRNIVGKGGGLYLSPTHSQPPEVPYENLFALVRAAEKYGGYRQDR
jgi:uroporphyrinogen decarboxylase